VAPAPAPPLELPVPPELPLDDRGFFSGEQTVVRLDLLDRATGKPLWSGEGTRSIDPRDREAVRALLDELLSDSPWALPAPASPSP
jgi:hypothetical protein